MIGKDINKAINLLQQGEVIGLPTETVYGLAANALDPDTVSRIFSIKQRPSFDPLIVHVSSFEHIFLYTEDFPEPLLKLAEAFMPGPLTLLLKKKSIIPDIVTSALAHVAIRIPNHETTLSVLKALDFPLAAPSANPFGYISPTTAQHVEAQLGNKIPYILDGGPCNIGIESTIVGMENDVVTIYRKGGLSISNIEKVVGKVKVKTTSSSHPAAPGMLLSHYAPKASVIIGEASDVNISGYNLDKIGCIRFMEKSPIVPSKNQIVLSETGNYKEAAKNLFAALRLLDTLNLDLIIAELLPEEDLGIAINDRLKRAAGV